MTPFNLAAWAIRHHVSQEAIEELRLGVMATLPADPPPDLSQPGSEAYVQSLVRLEAPQKGVRLYRNNVGALADATGRFVRYGLANDSEALNRVLKSPDLFGWRRVTIEQRHVGTVIAQAVGRECKHASWRYSGTDREQAQQAFGALLLGDGGDWAFTTGPGSL